MENLLPRIKSSSSNIIHNQGKLIVRILFTRPSCPNTIRWHEHDPLEIISSIETCIEGAVKAFENAGYSARSIKAVGITNQRETTVVWDSETGEPLYNVSVVLPQLSIRNYSGLFMCCKHVEMLKYLIMVVSVLTGM